MPSELEGIHSKNRNFICSCGKAYLSYAALFTHIKQKHGGKAPGQITRPRSLNKRGRPRKTDRLSIDKGHRSESYDGFLGNNNLKNINFANDSDFNQNQSLLKSCLGSGFTSFRNSNPAADSSRNPKKYSNNTESSTAYRDDSRQILNEPQADNLEFANPNNQLSSNTLALASIIMGLQQLFKEVNNLENVRDDKLQAFSSYIDLKRFHSKKLLQSSSQNNEEDVFLLGNIICAFLNFCHQTLEDKAAYQQIVLLIVCFLEHVKERKKDNILTSCKKEVIHECLLTFFQQYLEKVIIKFKLNFWIFKQNNAFKVIIWFLNWLSVIETNCLKNTQVPEVTDEVEQEYLEEEDAVQFEHPNFLNTSLKTQNIEKNQITQCHQNDQELFQYSSENQNNQDENSLQEIQEHDDEGEVSLNSSENPEGSNKQNKDFVGLERLSSEVR